MPRKRDSLRYGPEVSALELPRIEPYAPWLMLQKMLCLYYPMIKMLFWNIRGVARPPNLKRLKKLTKLHSIQLVVVVEPKTSVQNFTDIRMKLGMEWGMTNQEGTVWLFYRSMFTCACIGESTQHLTVQVHSHLFPSPTILFGIHANCTAQER